MNRCDDAWTLHGTSFVGHPMPVTVASFNPRIYTQMLLTTSPSEDEQKSSKSFSTCYCAIGSTDGVHSNNKCNDIILPVATIFSAHFIHTAPIHRKLIYCTVYACMVHHVGTFSLWSQALSVPVFTMQNAFDEAISDIAWSSDGKVLF